MNAHQLLQGVGLIKWSDIHAVHVGDQRGLEDVRRGRGQHVVDIDPQLIKVRGDGSREPTVAVDDHVLGLAKYIFLTGMGQEEGCPAHHGDGLDLAALPERRSGLLDLGEFLLRSASATVSAWMGRSDGFRCLKQGGWV
ncbi:hypothetical protein [Streptomyces microflavus]